MATDKNEPMSKRERIAVRLILMAVQILAPWEYSHQFKDVIEALKAELG